MIEIFEHSATEELALTDSDVAHLVSRHGTHVTLVPCGKKWKIRSDSHVGLMKLPSGQEIAVRPKVRVGNLLYIISYTHNLVDFKYLDKKQVEKNDSLLEIYAIVLLNWIETLFKKGLYKNYLEKGNELSRVRGKIVMLRNLRPAEKIWCEYDELSYSTLENRLIKGGLFFLLTLPLSSKTYQRALSYIRLLGDVERIEMTKESLAGVRYNRLNQHYRAILELFALLYTQTVLKDAAGKMLFSGYMTDMDMVFQYFILRILQKRLPNENVKSGRKSGWAQALQSDTYLPSIEPDVVIDHRLVLDTKYYKGPLNEYNKYHSDNLAQIQLYMQAYGLNGMLLYPQADEPFDHTYLFKGLKFNVHTFPLDIETEKMEEAIQNLVAEVRAHCSSPGSINQTA